MKQNLQLRLFTLSLIALLMTFSSYGQNALELKGILALEWTTSGTNGGKAIHLRAKEDISDLSVYAIGVANNGGGTDSIEYRFPVMSVSAGDDILLAREDATLSTYFTSCASEFEHVIQSDAMNQNGDDAIELFGNTTVIETYGDVTVDGTGEVWEYAGSWAYKNSGVWTYGGVDCALTSTTSEDSSCPYPLCGFGQGNDTPDGLELKGILALEWTTSGTNGGKAIHLRAKEDISDLSVYAIGVANNGGGTDSIEYRFPVMSVSAGDDILLAREDATLSTYFTSCASEFEHVIQSDAMNQNGDDAIELFGNTTVIETYGDVTVDGSGEVWEYAGSWAYKDNGVWTYGGVDCALTSTTSEDSSCPYPLCGFGQGNDTPDGLELKGILALEWTTSGTNGGKAIHLRAKKDISDLSVYAIGVANNGGGTDSIEYRFPVMSVSAGDDILLAREDATLSTYFTSCASEFEHVIQSDAMNQNGDDAIELFGNTTVIETYGDVTVDGTGEVWDYAGSWAYKDNGVWTYGGVDCALTSTTSEDSSCPYPLCGFGQGNETPDGLELKGILALEWTTSGTNGGKAIHLRAKEDISDLSVYAIGVANNGGGTDSIEYRFPVMSVSAGDDILLAREDAALSTYFTSCASEFEHVIQSDAMNQNGDDAIELFGNTTVIETYGDVNVDGTGEVWDYAGSWAYKDNGVWTYGGVDCALTSTTSEDSSCPYPLCGFGQGNDTPDGLELKGILALEWTTSGTNGGKAIHLRAKEDISDLSVYAIGVANNGGGTDSIEYRFPVMSVSAGDDILLAREDAALSTYFTSCASEFEHVIQSDAMNQNGDDAIELFGNTTVIETYGDVTVDGTGEVWEYAGSWAYKDNGVWTYGGVDCALTSTTSEDSSCPYPLCGFGQPEGIERSVLFIGNSYTFYFDMPKIVEDLAASVGDKLIQDENTEGGYTFEDHLADDQSIGKIKEGGWDYVVLQEQSTRPVRDIAIVEEQTFAKAAALDSIRQLANPVGDVMFYMTWGRKNSYEGLSFTEMNDLLRERYRTMQANQNGLISPVGAVWRYLRDNSPTIELYDADESHPSEAGSYLSACTFYTSIFQKDPTALSYDFNLSASDAQTIRAAVKAVVFDSLSYWNEYKPLPNRGITIDFDNIEEGQIFIDTVAIDYTVSVSSDDSQIEEVVFIANGDTLATDNSAPYNTTATIDGIGEYVITAVATDANGSKNYAIRNIIRTSSDVAKDLELVGVFALRWSTEPSVNSGKGIHLKALADIPDLSVYSIGVANNGDGTDGIEYTFPVMSVAAGDDILLAREDDALTAYFGDCADEIEHVIQADVMNQNGDDAIELYSGFTVIETYGDANVDGTGQEWEYTGSWAYKDNGAWIYGGLDCAANSTSMQDAECTYPLCIPPVITNDATLSQLLVDGEAIEGFVSGLLNYAIELPFDRTIVPEVSATTTDAGASLSINDAESLPGITSVVVTAVDGTTQRTYTIAFTLAEGGGTTLGMEEFEDIQIIMNNGRLYVKGESLRGIHSVEVYSLSGRKLNTHQTNNEVIAELHVPRGAVAIVRLMDEVGNMVYSKKIFIERQ